MPHSSAYAILTDPVKRADLKVAALGVPIPWLARRSELLAAIGGPIASRLEEEAFVTFPDLGKVAYLRAKVRLAMPEGHSYPFDTFGLVMVSEGEVVCWEDWSDRPVTIGPDGTLEATIEVNVVEGDVNAGP